MPKSSIPTLDLHDYQHGNAANKQAFVRALGEAYREIGFVALRNHLLTDAQQADLYTAVKAFFALPMTVKHRYHIAGGAGQRGYTGPGNEKAKDAQVPDLKEFYHVGQLKKAGDTDPVLSQYPDNVFPTEVADFERSTTEAYTQLESTGPLMLQAIAEYLGLPVAYFEDKVHNGNSILRPIHYFPLEGASAAPGAVRAGQHEDINLITLLMGASADGLELLKRDGTWLPVTAVPEALVVNVGDMLQRLTNNRLRSTTHRVVNPPADQLGTSRFSIPFFLHPRPEMRLDVLPGCVSEEHPAQYTPISAGEYLIERLREIGLM